MKIKTALWLMFFVVVVFLSNSSAHGQGMVTLNNPPVTGQYREYQNYYEQGMWFRVVAPAPNSPYHYMWQVASGITGGTAHNGTQHMRWSRFDEKTDSVVFSMTNGSAFGLTSVDLGNFGSSGQFSIAITFNAWKQDGSMISATFNTPNNNFTTFTTYNFGSAFGSGLTRVEIPSQFWAMDNLVFIPEPSTYALLGLGLFALGGRIIHKRLVRIRCARNPASSQPYCR